MQPYDAPVPRSRTLGNLASTGASGASDLAMASTVPDTRQLKGSQQARKPSRSSTTSTYPKSILKRPSISSEDGGSSVPSSTRAIPATGNKITVEWTTELDQSRSWLRSESPPTLAPIRRQWSQEALRATRERMCTPLWQRAQRLESRNASPRHMTGESIGAGEDSSSAEKSNHAALGPRTDTVSTAKERAELVEHLKAKLETGTLEAGLKQATPRFPRSSTGGLSGPSSAERTLATQHTFYGSVTARGRRQTTGILEDPGHRPVRPPTTLASIRSPSLHMSTRIPTPIHSRATTGTIDGISSLSPGVDLTTHGRQYRPCNRMSLNHPANPARTSSAGLSTVKTPFSAPRKNGSFCHRESLDLDEFGLATPTSSRIHIATLSAVTRDGCGEVEVQDEDPSEVQEITPASRFDHILQHMPLMWWLGRFCSIEDRLRTEELEVKTATARSQGLTDLGAGLDLDDKRHPSNTGMFDNNTRRRTVLDRLRALCTTAEAIKGFEDFKRRYEAKEGRIGPAPLTIMRKPLPTFKDRSAIFKKFGGLESKKAHDKVSQDSHPKEKAATGQQDSANSGWKFSSTQQASLEAQPTPHLSRTARIFSGRTNDRSAPTIGLSAGPNGSFILPPAPKDSSTSILPALRSTPRLSMGIRRRSSQVIGLREDKHEAQSHEQQVDSGISKKALMFGKIANRRRSKGKDVGKDGGRG